MNERLFCFGLGYTANVLARELQGRGWRISGTARSEEGCAALRQNGFAAYRFDRDHPLDPAADALAGTTHLLVSIGPDEMGDPVLDRHAADLRALGALGWVGWLGTTAVYGDQGGAWVDETSPLQPRLERARRRASAEQAWLASGLPVHLFRLAGIYGPGRNALVNLRKGTARRIVKPGQIFSRIHVADIVQVLLASMARPNPGRIYNVCDDEPAPPQDVVAHGARLLGVEPPTEQPFATADLSPMARSFYADSRRVSNARITNELGVSLRYPTYREGLVALLDD